MPTCTHCGNSIALPVGFDRPKVRCACGYYVDVPAAKRERSPNKVAATVAESTVADQPKPKPPAAVKLLHKLEPHDHRPAFDVEPGGIPLLAGTQDEEDDQPYAVPGTGLKNCPQCRGELPLEATFCVHCGTDFKSGTKAHSVKQPMYGVWSEGLSRQTRFSILAGMQVINFVGFALTVLEQRGNLFNAGTMLSLMVFQAFNLGLQLFLVGTYDTLIVKRDSRNRTSLTRIRRIGFYPMKPEKLDWKESTHLSIIGAVSAGFVEWYFCIYLLLLGCLPGILFYWFIIRPSRCHVHTMDVYGASQEVIFRTKDRDQADEICTFTRDATGLSYRVA